MGSRRGGWRSGLQDSAQLIEPRLARNEVRMFEKIYFKLMRYLGYIYDYGLHRWVKEPPGMYAAALNKWPRVCQCVEQSGRLVGNQMRCWLCNLPLRRR